MADEVSQHERMGELARDLQSRESSEETLQHIVAAAVDLLENCHSAGITLTRRRGDIEISACTDDLTRRSDELQRELGEGPCIDAAWNEKVVLSPDSAADERWPRWGPAAESELGIRSSLSVQLFTHEGRLGGLNLFSTKRHGFSPDDVGETRAIAAHAAVALMARKKIVQLDTALQSRTVTSTATGLAMATYDVSSVQAFAMLTRLSSERNVKLRTIAQEMVAEHDARRGR